MILCNARPYADDSAGASRAILQWVSLSFRDYYSLFLGRRSALRRIRPILGRRQSTQSIHGCRPGEAARRCCFFGSTSFRATSFAECRVSQQRLKVRVRLTNVGRASCTSTRLQCNLLVPFVSQPCSGVPASGVAQRHKSAPQQKQGRQLW